MRDQGGAGTYVPTGWGPNFMAPLMSPSQTLNPVICYNCIQSKGDLSRIGPCVFILNEIDPLVNSGVLFHLE